jgi:SAM-dependent methyltransferase
MHDTAYEIGGLFFQSYVNAESSVLEIGSLNINGGLRDFRPTAGSYIGVDLSPGNGVDVIVRRISQLPFRPETFDAVVSSSCLEHDLMFWVTFLEMCRVLKHGGYLYLNVPSKGKFHQYPIDAWRFFPDAGIGLRDWAKLNNHDIELLESFLTENRNDIWNDCVMIFGKQSPHAALSVSERYPLAMNIRRWPELTEIRRWREDW